MKKKNGSTALPLARSSVSGAGPDAEASTNSATPSAAGVSQVVYGPQGSDKGIHAPAIARRLGLHTVAELENVQLFGDPLRSRGYLYLSHSRAYAERAAGLLGTVARHIDEALAAELSHG